MRGSLVVDACGFWGRWPRWLLRWSLVDEGTAALDRYGIDKLVLASLRSVFYDVEAGNEEVLEACRKEPRYVPVVTLAPQMQDPWGCLERYVQSGARGVRLYPQHHGYRLESEPFVDELCRRAVPLGLPVWISVRLFMDWSLPTIDVRAVVQLVSRYPETTFVLSGVNYNEMREGLGYVRHLPNMLLETSCLQVFRGIETAVRWLGADRVLFGTGMPLQYPLCNVLKIDVAEVTEDEKHHILGETARRVFRLD